MNCLCGLATFSPDCTESLKCRSVCFSAPTAAAVIAMAAAVYDITHTPRWPLALSVAGQVVVIVIRLASLCCFCLLRPALKVHQHMQAHSAIFPLPYSFTVLPFPQNKSNGVGLDCTLSLFPHQQCCLRSACLEMQSSTRGKHNTQSDFYIKTTSACNPTTTMPAATPHLHPHWTACYRFAAIMMTTRARWLLKSVFQVAGARRNIYLTQQ